MSSIDNNQNKTILKHLLLVAGLFHDNELIEINCCNYNHSYCSNYYNLYNDNT